MDATFTSNVLTGNGKSGIGGVGHHRDHHNVISNNVCSENARWGIDAFDGADHFEIVATTTFLARVQEAAGEDATATRKRVAEMSARLGIPAPPSP